MNCPEATNARDNWLTNPSLVARSDRPSGRWLNSLTWNERSPLGSKSDNCFMDSCSRRA